MPHRDHPKRARRALHVPFPEALPEGRGFEVVDAPSGTGGVDFPHQRMHVPLGEGPRDRFVRLHEMGHVRWTPTLDPGTQARQHGVSVDALQVCEDARINTNLERAGFPMVTLGTDPAELAGFEHELREHLAVDPISAARRATHAQVAFTGRNPAGIARVLTHLSLGSAIRLAELVVATLLDGPETGPIPFERTIVAARLLDQGLPLVQVEGSGEDGPGLPCFEGSEIPGFVPWGPMVVEVPPMYARRVPPRAQQWRPRDTGLRIRQVSRILTDRKIFARKQRAQGGSLLIDCSGSMSISVEQIQRMLDVAPLVWVALYSGYHDSGVLRVVAREGRCVRPELVCAPASSYNVIDGPALQYLARQQPPRIWVCDGYVTGRGDGAGLGNMVEVAATCRAANIRRIPDVTAAIQYLTELAKAP